MSVENLKQEYNLEEKELFETYLEVFQLPSPKDNEKYYRNYDSSIELIVRAWCNQTCEYCYLHNYGKDLYPNRISNEEILHNADLILDYIYNQKKNYFYEIELFAGDMFVDDLYFDLLDVFKKYFLNIKKKDKEIFNSLSRIVTPCNLSWVFETPEKIEKFDKYFNYFKDNFNTLLTFSWSTDGFYAVETRERKKLSEEYFDTIFEFCKKYDFGYHPMIAPENIKFWCENYDWWMKKFEKYHLIAKNGWFQPYLLEVRNNNWTPELNKYHTKLLEHMMEYRLKLCNNDYEELAYHLIVGDGENNTYERARGCDPLVLFDEISGPQEGVCCSGQSTFHFNLSNLSIVYCHRLSYAQFTPIYFLTNEDNSKIIDIKTNNIGAFLTWRFHKPHLYPVCASCKYEKICKKGCLGSQFEHSGELYMPINSLCEFFKEKFEALYYLYKKYHIIENIEKLKLFDKVGNNFYWLKERIAQDNEKEVN